MSFLPSLKEAVQRVEGAVSASIIGIDGMPVEEFSVEKLVSLEDLSAESSQMMKDLGTVTRNLGLGRASEFSFSAELCVIIMRKINEEYYMALVIRPEGNFGKGRFVLRTMVERLAPEF